MKNSLAYRLGIIITVLVAVTATAHADVYGDIKVTNAVSGAPAFKEFAALQSQYTPETRKNQRSIKKYSDVSYITANASPTIVGYTVQESYTLKLGVNKYRVCSSEIHTSDLSQPAAVNFECRTEQY